MSRGGVTNVILMQCISKEISYCLERDFKSERDYVSKGLSDDDDVQGVSGLSGI